MSCLMHTLSQGFNHCITPATELSGSAGSSVAVTSQTCKRQSGDCCCSSLQYLSWGLFYLSWKMQVCAPELTRQHGAVSFSG